MSTAIMNAFRVAFTNDKKISQLTNTLRHLVEEARETYVHQLMARQLVSFFRLKSNCQYDYVKHGLNREHPFFDMLKKDIPFKHRYLLEHNDLKHILNNSYICDKFHPFVELFYVSSEFKTGGSYDLNIRIFLKKMGRHTYFIISGENDLSYLIGSLIKERQLMDNFEYWNSTDGPSDVSTREWDQRGRTWNTLLSGSLNLNDCMYLINCQYTYKIMAQPARIIENIPSDYDLFSLYYKQKYLDDYSNKMISQEKEKAELEGCELSDKELLNITVEAFVSIENHRKPIDQLTPEEISYYKADIYTHDELIEILFS